MSGSLKKMAKNSDPAGFPFILGTKHHSRKRSDGKLVEMENGHGALILEINPRYVFGEQWSPKQPHAAPDPQILPGSAADFFPSMVTNCQQLYDQKNKKKEEAQNSIPAEAVKVSASGSVTKKNERTRPEQATPATKVSAFGSVTQKIEEVRPKQSTPTTKMFASGSVTKKMKELARSKQHPPQTPKKMKKNFRRSRREPTRRARTATGQPPASAWKCWKIG